MQAIMPVQVLGMSDVAIAGDEFIVAPDERTARDVADTREHYQRVATIGRILQQVQVVDV